MPRIGIGGLTAITLLMIAFAACESSTNGLTMLNVTSATHSKLAIDSASSHATLTCADCHGTYDNFLVLGCTDCHTHDQAVVDPKHSTVSGYVYVSASCYSCHPTGNSSAIEHRPTFLIGTGTKHATAACADCHIDPANRKNVDCTGASCHPQATMDSGHANVLSGSGGYVWNTSDCLNCHSTPTVFRVSSHNSCVFHQGARCRTCHTGGLTTKPFPAINFAAYTCTACHENRGTSCNGG